MHPQIQRHEIVPLDMRAEFQPATINKEKRTIELVWSTGATVRRGGFFTDPFDEELAMDPANIRMDRLNRGAPLLNSHSQYDLSNVMGVVERAWIENGVGKATVRFSQRDDVGTIFKDVEDGVIRNVSVGYRVYKYQDVTKDDSRIKTFRAVDWEPFEISLVPIPADAAAQVRSNPEKNTVEIEMRNIPLGGEQDMNPKPTETPQPAAQPVDTDAIRKQAQDEERGRVTGITAAVRAAKLDDDLAQDMIAKGVSLDEARKLIIEELGKRSSEKPVSSHPSVTVGTDEVEHRRAGMESALLHRVDTKRFELSEKAREFRHFTLLEMARESLEARGIRTRGMSKMEVAARALHTTSDFKSVLENVVNKTLRAGYESAPQTFRPFVRETQVADFKQVSRTQLGDAPKLKEVLEDGEFTFGSMKDGAEKYQLKTYGKIIGITRQVIINDDLGAFTRVPELFGRSAADLESDVVWGIITANAAMSDGTALFHSSHGNLAGSGAVPSVTTLTAARRAMRVQMGLSDDAADLQYINVMAKFLAIPPKYETDSEQLLSSTMLPNQVSSVNPFAGKLQLIVEPRLEIGGGAADPWYTIADPSQIDTIEIAYLQGQQGVYIETKEGFEVDGLMIKARHDFAAKAIDWKGMYKNPGTAGD